VERDPGLPAHPDHHRPADGSYTAVDPDTDYGAGDPITFYVASSGRELENIAMTYVTVYCTETTATQDHLTLSSAAVSATGAFSGSETQSGVFAGTAAKFTYVFKGDFEGKNPNDIQRQPGRSKRPSLTRPWTA